MDEIVIVWAEGYRERAGNDLLFPADLHRLDSGGRLAVRL